MRSLIAVDLGKGPVLISGSEVYTERGKLRIRLTQDPWDFLRVFVDADAEIQGAVKCP